MSLSLAGSALLFPVEKLVNGLIAGDAHVAGNLTRFHGKRVEVRTPHTGLNLLFDAGGIRLSTLDSEALGEPADVTVRGTAPQLFRLLTDSERPLADREIRVEGDAELLLDLQRALDEIDVRWEDYLGPILGDVLTGGLSSAVTDARDLARDAGGNIKRNLENFVQYEAGVMPSPEEMGLFVARVDELRLRLDRLQARIENLDRPS
ncbi:MAG: SCP2 sterol-binding domain-containing protein [Gammaproteobacteria bacterium]|nr:SCP2 sterol-binding domain-containing protein [Gammaproteobacteria bacterium]